MRRDEDLFPAGPGSQGEPEIRNLDPTVHLPFATSSLGAVHSNALGIAMLPGVRCPMVMVRHRQLSKRLGQSSPISILYTCLHGA